MEGLYLHVARRRVGSDNEGTILAVRGASHCEAAGAVPDHLGFMMGLSVSWGCHASYAPDRWAEVVVSGDTY